MDTNERLRAEVIKLVELGVRPARLATEMRMSPRRFRRWLRTGKPVINVNMMDGLVDHCVAFVPPLHVSLSIVHELLAPLVAFVNELRANDPNVH